MAEMTLSRRFLPQPREVVLLLPPGGQLIGVIGFIEAFDVVNRVRAERGQGPAYAIRYAGVGDAITSIAGMPVLTEPADRIASLHTLVVGGGLQLARGTPADVVAAVHTLGSRAERIVGVCAGAFPLGDAGFLDGRRCTTHWLALDDLRERFPTAQVQDDAIFVEDGPVFTSAGATAGIDLSLHLIAQDFGSKLASFVARCLVVFARRPGGQSQFGAAVRLRPSVDDVLHQVIGEILHDPAADHRVDVLASRAGMSPRNFARVFRDQTGETPAAFVTQVRVEASQRLLGQSDAGLDAIAADCGFGSTDTFRRAFRRVTGVSPGAWRERFALDAIDPA